MNCKKCNRPNREIAHFCKWCGSPIEITQQNLMPQIVGMNDIKDKLVTIVDSYAKLSRRAKVTGMEMHVNNDCIIMGPAGSGKTTLVKAIAKLFHAQGMTVKPNPIIVDAVEYSGYMEELGEDIQKLQELRGNILCIDNAQKLINLDSTQIDDLAQVLMLKKSMPDDFILILCGLDTGLGEYLQTNPNVSGLFAHQFKLTDYKLPQFMGIITQHLDVSWRLTLTPDALGKLERVLKKKFQDADEELKGNGHYAIKLANAIGEATIWRAGENASKVEPCDIPGEEYIQKSTDEVLATLDKFVGIDEIRKTIQDIVNSIKEERENGQKYELKDHYIFLGNPGTGKTTIARIFADIFCSLELLPVGQLVEVSRAELVSQWVGETPKTVKQYVDKAMGGILFIDEAYTLIKDENDDVGKEAVDTLLKLIEDRRGKFVCIAAGYTNDMRRFLDSNPGMKDRFNVTVNFRDYRPDELEQIFRGMVANGKPPYTLSQDADEHLSIFFKMMYNMRQKDFANARSVRNCYENAKKRHNNRMQRERAEGRDISAEKNILTREDIEGDAASRTLSVEDVLAELDELVGMKEVKHAVRQMANRIKIDKDRIERGLLDPSNAANHIVLTGNPGTGKTTVALMLGKIFKAIGLLPSDKVVEKEAKNLKSSYVNDTGKLVDKACDEAMGGVLFIDEAYMLMKIDDAGNNDATGEEAIAALMTRMSKDAGKFIVVMAGYKKEMDEFIDHANPGFRRRFKTFINIEDYSASELVQIFQMQTRRSRMKLSEQALIMLNKMVNAMVHAKNENWGNAGEMTNLLEKVKDRQSERLSEEVADGSDLTDEQLVTIEACDIPYECPEPLNPQDVLAKLDNLIGLQSVKQEIRELANTLNANILRAKRQGIESKVELDHYIFTGNPGTGKTTVAQMMAEIFYSLGLLPTNKLVEVTRKDLVMGYSGQTAINVARVVKSALGGVLFIDEAYALKQHESDSFGQEAIDTLLPMLLTYKNKFICIAAGYSREMQQWLNTNSGLTSRFTETIEFPDYQPDELADIFRMKARKENYTWDADTDAALEQYFRDLYARRDQNFGNARAVGTFFNKVKKRQSSRITALDTMAPDFDDTLLSQIIPDDLLVEDN